MLAALFGVSTVSLSERPSDGPKPQWQYTDTLELEGMEKAGRVNVDAEC